MQKNYQPWGAQVKQEMTQQVCKRVGPLGVQSGVGGLGKKACEHLPGQLIFTTTLSKQ